MTTGNIPDLVHGNRHATGQPDAITPASIGAAPLASPVFTGSPEAPTASPANANPLLIATAGYADTSSAAAVVSLGQSFIFSQDPAFVKASGKYPPNAVAWGHWAVRLECESAPVGSALTVVLRYTTDHGATFTTIATMSIASGATVLFSVQNVAVAVPAGAQVCVNGTSAGSGTAATGVELSAVATA